jgi:hypothetical protein
VATPVAPELHTPPLKELLRVVVEPAQIVVVPVIADGDALTVITFVALHPVDKV